MNKKTWVALLVLIAAGAAGTAWWRGKAASDAAAAASGSASAPGGAPQTVSVTAVQRRDVPVNLEAAGTIVSLNTVDVRAQVATTVREVAIREGQYVKRGDLLFTLDDRTDRANLEKARAQLMRDRATLADLNRQWTRAQDLLAQNFIAQSAADAVRTQVEAQQGAVQADAAAVQAAEVALSYGSMRSPLAGRAGAIAVYPGSQVQPGGAALVTISQMDPIGVSFTLPEAQLGAVLRPGAVGGAGAGNSSGNGIASRAASAPSPAASGNASNGVAGPLKLSVVLPGAERGGRGGGTNEAVEGQLSFIDNAVDTATGTIRLKGSLPNARQQLWPGQYVVVRMTLRTIKDATVVPQAALIQRGADRIVYVVDGDGKAQSRAVQLRYPFGEFAVVDGLNGDERVVLEGKQNLRPGVPVRIAASGAARAASAASAGASR